MTEPEWSEDEKQRVERWVWNLLERSTEPDETPAETAFVNLMMGIRFHSSDPEFSESLYRALLTIEQQEKTVAQVDQIIAQIRDELGH